VAIIIRMSIRREAENIIRMKIRTELVNKIILKIQTEAAKIDSIYGKSDDYN